MVQLPWCATHFLFLVVKDPKMFLLILGFLGGCRDGGRAQSTEAGEEGRKGGRQSCQGGRGIFIEKEENKVRGLEGRSRRPSLYVSSPLRIFTTAGIYAVELHLTVADHSSSALMRLNGHGQRGHESNAEDVLQYLKRLGRMDGLTCRACQRSSEETPFAGNEYWARASVQSVQPGPRFSNTIIKINLD